GEGPVPGKNDIASDRFRVVGRREDVQPIPAGPKIPARKPYRLLHEVPVQLQIRSPSPDVAKINIAMSPWCQSNAIASSVIASLRSRTSSRNSTSGSSDIEYLSSVPQIETL